jgi:hypothetical protein
MGINSAFLLGILTTWAYLRIHGRKDRPAAVFATYHRLTEHAPNQRTATSAAAGPGAHAGAFADLLEGFRAGLNRFDHRAFADLVA